jgi:hypothetical protein
MCCEHSIFYRQRTTICLHHRYGIPLLLLIQNVSLHSEGAALLLVWTANLVKLYACSKKLGDTVNENMKHNISLDLDEVQKVTARTKL